MSDTATYEIVITPAVGNGTTVRVQLDPGVQVVHLGSAGVGNEESPEHCYVAVKGTSVGTDHAELLRQPDGSWLIQDLGLPEGTFLAGRPVGGPTPVTFNVDGSCAIRLGRRSIFLRQVALSRQSASA